MKKIWSLIVILLVVSFTINAQEATTFLGIPIDGTKSEMIAKLKAKGYKQSTIDRDALEGEFNGEDVLIYVQTNNNKVYRIAVLDATSRDEGQIKIRYNNLCSQFQNNARYSIADSEVNDNRLSDSEDISYEMSVHNKQYQATYIQRPDDPGAYNRLVWFTIGKERYGKYSIAMFYENLNNKATGEDL